MSNTIGNRFKVTIFGQSHAPSIGTVIEGIPAGIALNMDAISAFMARRAPGGPNATSRAEADTPRIIAGLNERGLTCGAPLCAVIDNTNQRSGDYDALRDVPRPGHADYTAYLKFGGENDIRGGGQFSGRLTAPLCFAGAVAAQLPQLASVRVFAHVVSIGSAEQPRYDPLGGAPNNKEPLTPAMLAEIQAAREAGDSIGGVIEAMALGVPAALGDPMFDGVENRIARIIYGIPGVRGVEFGLGFEAARMRGSQHNDGFYVDDAGRVRTLTNNHGGALGGITTGMPIIVRAAFKPTPSIALEQRSVSLSGQTTAQLNVTGRHDPCIAVRAVPVMEAALTIAIADMIMEG